MGYFIGWILGIDISYYQQKVIGWILKAAGVKVAYIKASGGMNKDPKFREHVLELHDAGFLVGAYHWVDPTVDPIQQAKFFLKCIEGLPIRFLVCDVEQWWANWATWYKAILGKLAWNLVARLNPDRISDHAEQFAEYLRSVSTVQVVLSTSRGFVTSWASKMSKWLNRFPLILAAYTYKVKAFTLDWDTFKSKYIPQDTRPALPPGTSLDNFIGWQFTGDTFILAGTYGDAAGLKASPLDVNIFDPEFVAGIAAAKLEPVVIKEYYQVSNWVSLGLRFRKSPDTDSEILGSLQRLTMLEATGEKAGKWVQVVYNNITGWVHSDYVLAV